MILGTTMEVRQLRGVAAQALEQLQVCQNWKSTTEIYNSNLNEQSFPSSLILSVYQFIIPGRQDWKAKYLK